MTATGSTEIEFLPWDTDILGLKSGAIQVNIGSIEDQAAAELCIQNCINQARKDGYRFLFTKLDTDHPLIVNALLSKGGFLADTELCFQKKPGSFTSPEISEISYKISTSFWDEHFYDVAETLDKSRFFRDPRVDLQTAVTLWKESIRNHCCGRASYTVVAFRNLNPVGFINVIERSGISNIFIIGVLPLCQGSGIGVGMLNFYEQHLPADITEMTVDTQLTNLKAQKLYLKHGYRIHKSKHVIHLWL